MTSACGTLTVGQNPPRRCSGAGAMRAAFLGDNVDHAVFSMPLAVCRRADTLEIEVGRSRAGVM